MLFNENGSGSNLVGREQVSTQKSLLKSATIVWVGLLSNDIEAVLSAGRQPGELALLLTSSG